MARQCSICVHPERNAIDQAIVAGGSLRDVAGRFGTKKSSLDRHKREHLRSEVQQAAERAGEAAEVRGDGLLEQLRALNARALKMLDIAERATPKKGIDVRAAWQGYRECRENLKAMADLLLTINFETRIAELEQQLQDVKDGKTNQNPWPPLEDDHA